MGFISRSWKGNEDLWKVFWLYNLPASVLLFWLDSIKGELSAGYSFIYFGKNILILWLIVSLWRCAFNARWALWGYLTRLYVLAPILLFLGYFFITLSQPQFPATAVYQEQAK
jgi:hypothetical protein